MKQGSFLSLFPGKKPIIGMVHLQKLDGQRGFISEEYVIAKAKHDIQMWQQGGIDGLIIENWQEEAVRPRISRRRAASLRRVIVAISGDVHVPFGINVLNNDYQTAYAIASVCSASFIQLDTFVDRVVSDFTYNVLAKSHPFVVEVDRVHMKRVARYYGQEALPVLCGIHPKHYRMIDAKKTIEQSAKEAKEEGAAGVVITKATGVAPYRDVFLQVRSVIDIPVGIGSGFSPDTAKALFPLVDFAIVGTYAKIDGVTDNPVDSKRVSHLMRVVAGCR
jgi:membrane complex biogenesis BtpA family protein